MPMSEDEASAVALKAASWLAAESDRLGHFLAATGLSPDDLRTVLASPDAQAAILDFVLMDDAWVLDFSGQAGLDPQSVAAARAALPGGELPHWT